MNRVIKKIIFLVGIPVVFFSLVSFTGCKSKSEVKLFNPTSMQQLVAQAAKGSKVANDSLSGLFDLNLPGQSIINKIEIDSIKTGSGKTFYGVLAEFPNPFFNRFAVYDSSLQCYFIDKSLNGYLSLSSLHSEKRKYFQVSEQFNAKDILSLKRKSLYLIDKDSMNLALRIFTQFYSPTDRLSQTVETFDDNFIQTEIVSEKGIAPRQTWDTFTFSEQLRKFISQSNYFDSLTIDLTSQFINKPVKPFFFDQSSALKALGVQLSVDSAQSYNNYKNKKEKYSLYLPEGWKAVKGTAYKEVIHKSAAGTKFVNASLGASFVVLKLKENEKAEDYSSFEMKNKVEGNYSVRFSEKNLIGKKYYVCFEVRCFTSKFLVVVECPESLYDENKTTFEAIINSFWIDC